MAVSRQTIKQSPKEGVRAVFRGDGTYSFVRALYEPGGSFGPHLQRTYQLVVMLQGSASVQVNKDSVILQEGEGILMQPGWRVFYLFDKNRRSLHTGCQANLSSFNKSERRLLTTISGVHPIPAAVHVLIGEGLSSPLHCGSQFHAATALLAKACILRFAANLLESPRLGAPLHPALQRALEILETAPMEFSTANSLAKRCGISVSRLRQLFQEAGKESPSAMLWRIKTDQAVQMLRSTGLTLDEIATQSGFANPFHLSRSVKKLTGRSPRELRRIEWE